RWSVQENPMTNDAVAAEPWKWPEQQWRAVVNHVRAGRTLRPPEWPGGARCAVALSFDSDHETNELRDGGKSIGRLCWGQYGNRVGVPRILALLARYARAPRPLLRPGGVGSDPPRRAATRRGRGSRAWDPRVDPRAECGAGLRGRARSPPARRRHPRACGRRTPRRHADAVVGFQPAYPSHRQGDGARL